MAASRPQANRGGADVSKGETEHVMERWVGEVLCVLTVEGGREEGVCGARH